MSFGVPPQAPAPPAPMAAPPTAPPQMKKRFNPRKLSPEMQAQLAAGQPIQFEDGSAIMPDGSLMSAGDSPDDFGMGAPDGTMVDGDPAGDYPLPAPEADPFAGRQFDRHFAVREAQPSFFGDEAEADNPMQDPLPSPFETPEPAKITSASKMEGPSDPVGLRKSMNGGSSITGSKRPMLPKQRRRTAGPPTKPTARGGY